MTSLTGLARVEADVRTEHARQLAASPGPVDYPDGTGGPYYEGRAASARRTVLLADSSMPLAWSDRILARVFTALSRRDGHTLRTALVEAIATLVQWVEAIDRRQAPPAPFGDAASSEPFDGDALAAHVLRSAGAPAAEGVMGGDAA